MTPSDQESREKSRDKSREESDWGVTMSNSPNLGPIDSIRVAVRRIRGRE